jgi:hypothetical protein
MSDAAREVRALPPEAAACHEELRRLRGQSARTPAKGMASAPSTTKAKGQREGEREQGSETGGAALTCAPQPYHPVEIARRAAESAPGAVPFERQFGAQIVTAGEPRATPPKAHGPTRQHQGTRGGPK